MKYFILAAIFFVLMILTLFLLLYVYIQLVIAVRKNKDVPDWVYKLGHSLKGRGRDVYKDFTDRSVLNYVNSYIIGIIVASIIVYFIFYKQNYTGDKIMFWLNIEFLIIIVMRAIIWFGDLFLRLILSKAKNIEHNGELSASGNAVISMFIILIFISTLTLTMTGLPVKAPTIQVGESEIVIGHTKAKKLLSNGFTFAGKNSTDIIKNKRDSHLFFGETVNLVKDGKIYGKVNLTPKYMNKAKLEDCIITYFSTSSKNEMISDIKIYGKDISKLALNNFEKENMKNVFSLSPISYKESRRDRMYSIIMQRYPYMLWTRYTVRVIFFSDNISSQFEVYAQHTIWE